MNIEFLFIHRKLQQKRPKLRAFNSESLVIMAFYFSSSEDSFKEDENETELVVLPKDGHFWLGCCKSRLCF